MRAALDMVNRSTIREIKTIKKVCEPAFQVFNLNFLYCNWITNDGRLVSIGTHAEWMEHYYSGCLFLDNPYFCSPSLLSDGFYKFQLTGSHNIQETCKIANQMFQVTPSCAFIRKSSQGCVQFGMSFKNDAELSMTRLVNERNILIRFFDYFESELGALIKQSSELSLNLLDVRGNRFHHPLEVNSQRINQNARAQLLQAMEVLDPRLTDINFTHRQLECVHLLLKGLTNKEIGRALNLSHRTVESHIENIRGKFGNSYRNELRENLQVLSDLELFHN